MSADGNHPSDGELINGRRLLQLVLLEGEGPDGEPTSKTILGYLRVTESGGLIYETVIEDERAGAAAELMQAPQTGSSLPPSSPPAEHAVFISRSVSNLMRNPRWEPLPDPD